MFLFIQRKPRWAYTQSMLPNPSVFLQDIVLTLVSQKTFRRNSLPYLPQGNGQMPCLNRLPQRVLTLEVSFKVVFEKALLSVLWQTCLVCRAYEVANAVSFDSGFEFSIEWKGFWHIVGNPYLDFLYSVGFFSWAFNSIGIRLQGKYSWLTWAEINTLLISLTVDKSMWLSCLGPKF